MSCTATTQELVFCVWTPQLHPVTPHLDSVAAVQIVTAWNGMGVAAFAEAAMVLKQEQPAATRDFPVEGCKPSEYQRAAIKVLAWLSAVLTRPANFSAVLVAHLPATHQPGLAL